MEGERGAEASEPEGLSLVFTRNLDRLRDHSGGLVPLAKAAESSNNRSAERLLHQGPRS